MKILLYLLAYLSYIYLGFCFCITMGDWVVYVFHILLSTLSLLPIFLLTFRLFHRGPAIVINKEGISWNCVPMMKLHFSWDEILSLRLSRSIWKDVEFDFVFNDNESVIQKFKLIPRFYLELYRGDWDFIQFFAPTYILDCSRSQFILTIAPWFIQNGKSIKRSYRE